MQDHDLEVRPCDQPYSDEYSHMGTNNHFWRFNFHYPLLYYILILFIERQWRKLPDPDNSRVGGQQIAEFII